MIKIKKKIVSSLLLGTICCVSMGVMALNTPVKANAAANTTPKYSMEFDYVITTTDGTGGGTSTHTKKGTGYSVSVQTGPRNYSNTSVYIYGQSYSGSGSLTKGGYINSSTVNIGINNNLGSGSITVKNSSGSQVGRGNRTLNLTNLSDGRYNVLFYFGGGGWATTSRSGTSVKTEATSSFVVDSNKPTMSGVSSTTNGTYKNGSFTVNAHDSGSGVKGIYYKVPNSSGYSYSSGSSKSFSSGVDGVYTFYAVDYAGNKSSYYYVNYDGVNPTGVIKDMSGNTVYDTSTNREFYYTASDARSGIDYMQYKIPGSSWWNTYNGQTITASDKDGKYEFRAFDKAGNMSDAKTIIFDRTKPVGYLYVDGKIVGLNQTVKGDYIQFMGQDSLSGLNVVFVKEPNASDFKPYTNGSQYAKDGTYSFYCTDKAGNTSALFTITLDNKAPIITCEETEFYSTYGRGFTIKTDSVDDKLYFRKPDEYEFILLSGNTYTVKETDKDGKYYFYAEDKIGNKTAVYWIEMKIAYPEPSIMELSDGSKYVTWSDNSCTATLNGNPYQKNSIIKKEGEYKVVVTNSFGRTKTIEFKIEHNYEVVKVVEGTCTTDGYTEYRCSLCGHTYKDNIVKAKGHTYSEEIISATCTEGGCIRHTCTKCGETYESAKTDALGHNYIEETVQATCTEDGGLKHTCTRCGHSYLTDKVPAIGHDYESEVTLAPTCTTDGERHFRCRHCGDEYTSKIPCQGHQYEISETNTENGITTRKYICSICGEEYTQDMGEQYEKVSNYVEKLFNQYSPYMIWVFLATSGVWSIAMGAAYIIARKNEDKVKAKKMLVNYGIGMIVIFGILVACPYLVRGIAFLVT